MVIFRTDRLDAAALSCASDCLRSATCQRAALASHCTQTCRAGRAQPRRADAEPIDAVAIGLRHCRDRPDREPRRQSCVVRPQVGVDLGIGHRRRAVRLARADARDVRRLCPGRAARRSHASSAPSRMLDEASCSLERRGNYRTCAAPAAHPTAIRALLAPASNSGAADAACAAAAGDLEHAARLLPSSLTRAFVYRAA